DGLTVTVTYQYTYGSIPQTAMAQLGLSFATGALGQATWAYLTTNFSAQAIGYSGLAMVYAQDYALGTSAQVGNHTFEVMGPQAYSISSTIPDANPASAAWDALINGRYGAAFPSGMLENVTPWSSYCLASGLLLSPALETQIQASEFVATMGTLTNTAPVWSGGKLKMIPYGDVTLTANGATYTPNTTPIYDLTDDDYLGGGDPIKVSRKPQADAYNHIRIEFVNRANLYNVEIAEAKDSANIDANGLRSASIFSAHWICDASIARTVAQIMLQRAVYVRNTYTFTLAWTKALLEPMDLVTLTDSGLGFNKLPVRIIEIAESENGDLSVVAEEYPQGVASATLYATQSGGGFQHDYNAAPGSIAAPMIFEAPGALAQNGLEIYVAATGTGAAWGGCNVWVSLDGTNYKNIGTLNGGSRYGTLSAACGASGTVSVALNSGVLASGSVADAAALNTLCYIGGAAKEFFAFNTATLTSALHYDLGGTNNRGAYVTPAAAHASGDKFARVDSAIARSGPVDLVYVGKTIHVKCTSFNIYGANEESLASVTDYTYTVTGAQIQNNAGAAALTGITSAASDNILSASEKPPIIQDYTVITGEQSGLDAQATSYSITTEKTAYDAAITALTAYLATLTAPTLWSNVAGDTTIVGTTFRSNFAAVYT
ncbi:MAG: phage tail protein, partial [Betaproteobacteria bacterium]